MHFALHLWTLSWKKWNWTFTKNWFSYYNMVWGMYLQKCKFLLNSSVWKWIINWNKANKHTSQNRLYLHIFFQLRIKTKLYISQLFWRAFWCTLHDMTLAIRLANLQGYFGIKMVSAYFLQEMGSCQYFPDPDTY